MAIALLILSVLLWICSIVALPSRPLYAPALSYLGLLCLSFCSTSQGYPWVPISWTMLLCWLSMTLIVMFATMLQPAPVRAQARGMGYMIVGAFAGMIVGLLGVTLNVGLNLLYGIMIVSTIVGIFLGFLLYSNTPDGKGVSLSSGHFFKYLLAKGFPTAVTVMQIGLALAIVLSLYIS